jgi:ADP-ribose pyrophosphatase YjhB (NUDIX family)
VCQTCPSYLETVRRLILESEARGAEQEAKDRAVGKDLRNDPLGRMLEIAPLRSCVLPPVGGLLDEVVLIHTPEGPVWTRLATSATRFLDSRRQWGAFEEVGKILRANLTEEGALTAIHELFLFSFGAMGICRRYEPDGTSYVLMGIRGAKLATLNVGQASFPAGLAKPNESVECTLLREFEEETGVGVGQVLRYPGFATFRFPDACSMTFTGMLETKTRQPLKSCYEVKGKTFTWVPEHALAETIAAGMNKELVQAFRDNDINVPDDLKVTNDGAATYLRLATVYPP